MGGKAELMTSRERLERLLGERNIGRWFISFCLLFGIPLIFLYPPFIASDEIAHFYRAYQISEFTIIAEARWPDGGGMLPRSLSETTGALTTGMFRVPGFTLDMLDDIPKLPLNPGDRVWTAFTNTALYSPLAYLPQAAGLLVGRLLSLTPLTLQYIARVCSLLTWAAMGAYALKIVPFFKNVLFLILLTPLVFSKAAVVTADVVTVGACAILSCHILRMAFGEGCITRRDILLLFGWAALVGLCKITYAPLVALCFMIPAERLGGRKRFFLICGGAVLLAFVVNLLWTGILVSNQPLQTSNTAQPAEQVRYMLRNPFAFVMVVLRYTYERMPINARYILGEIIVWDHVWMPVWVIFMLWVSIVLAAAADKATVVIQAWKRAGVLAVVLITYVVIIASLYVSFTLPRLDYVQGMQARYMLPLLFPMMLLIKNDRFSEVFSRRLDRLSTRIPSAIVLPSVCLLVSFVSLTMLLVVMYVRFV